VFPFFPLNNKEVKMKNPIFEAFKDIARLVVFAVPGILIGYFTGLPETQTTVLVLLVLRAIDSYIHNNPEIPANGLTPF
jgi:hypothetical protein